MAKQKINWQEPVVTVCYNQTQKWITRREAFDYFEECMYATEGSESEHYKNICMELRAGEMVAKD